MRRWLWLAALALGACDDGGFVLGNLGKAGAPGEVADTFGGSSSEVTPSVDDTSDANANDTVGQSENEDDAADLFEWLEESLEDM